MKDVLDKKIDSDESSTAKGVNIATEFNDFKDVLFNKKIIRQKMKRMQAKKHKIGTYEINKIFLSCIDDERLILDDGIHTPAYFHRDCNKKMWQVVFYIRVSGKFSYFFYKKFLHTKKSIKSKQVKSSAFFLDILKESKKGCLFFLLAYKNVTKHFFSAFLGA